MASQCWRLIQSGAMNQHTSPRVREVTIDEGSDGQRIDNFLLKELKGVPKSRIYRILRKGEVRVNKGRIKADYRLKRGDRVRIPPIRVAESSHSAPISADSAKFIENHIIFEDERYLIIDKPSGLAVHGGSGVSLGVIEALRAARPEAPFLELGHRLDRDTSGCLVLAKKRSALREFQELMRSNRVEKRYLCLVKGRWKGSRHEVNVPLAKNVLKSGERVVRAQPDGKEALSIFEKVTAFRDATLMRVELITGRTHQVRVHAQYSGHPIGGDDKYGDDEFNRLMKERGLKRLFLHSAEIAFTPKEGVTVRVEAPLEPVLNHVLANLEVVS